MANDDSKLNIEIETITKHLTGNAAEIPGSCLQSQKLRSPNSLALGTHPSRLRPHRIVKIGGSLLDLPDLNERLRRWLASQTAFETLVIVGGGGLIDQIRKLDAIHHFDDDVVHWACVDLLDTTAQLISDLVVDWNHIETELQWSRYLEQLRSSCLRSQMDYASKSNEESKLQMPFSMQPTIVNVSAFYRPNTADDLPLKLPTSWATTTDSIAALLASIVDAQELILLKSCAVPASCSIHQAQHIGIVDDAFPSAIDRAVSVQIVNFRDDAFSRTLLTL